MRARLPMCFVDTGKWMSSGSWESGSMSIADKSRYAAAGFVVLLILSVLWPAPVVSINRLWLHRDLPVDELSFLGREAPSWDAVFWCMAGLFAIAVVQSGEASAAEVRAITRL